VRRRFRLAIDWARWRVDSTAVPSDEGKSVCHADNYGRFKGILQGIEGLKRHLNVLRLSRRLEWKHVYLSAILDSQVLVGNLQLGSKEDRLKNVEGNILTIKVDLSKEFGPSSSGKTIIIASTEGERVRGGPRREGRAECISQKAVRQTIGVVEMNLDNLPRL
jgi:hypothetical protein